MPSYKDPKTGLWYCQFYYEDWKGHRRHTSKRGFARKKDADMYERQYKEKSGQEVITMAALIDLYLEHCKTLVKLGALEHTTYITKQANIDNYIRFFFDDATVDRVDMDVVNQWLSILSKKNRRIKTPRIKERKGITTLSLSTIKNARSLLSQIFDYAIKTHRATENPVKYSDMPTAPPKAAKPKLWTLEQYQRFYSVLTREEYRVLYNIFFWTGMRIGEILDLRPADITPYKISVSKTWIELPDGSAYSKAKPKNKYSIREVEIPRAIYFQVNDYIAQQFKMKPNDRIFEVTSSSIRNHLRYWCRKLELPPISPHKLRHSYASLLLNVTNDIMLVSSQLGHANIITTGKVYVHQIPGANRAGVDKLEEATKNVETIDVQK